MPESLKLREFNDRDLLRIIHDVADEEGWSDSWHIAEKIFPKHMRGNREKSKYALRCVGIRLSWLHRYGVVSRHPEKDSRGVGSLWMLTNAGETFLNGRLSATQEKQLAKIKEDQLVEITNWLTQNYLQASPVAATLMRRTWQYGLFRR